jgi:hypothetical protein
MEATATRGAVSFPRRVVELLRAALALRGRHAAVEISTHRLAVVRGRLENELTALVWSLNLRLTMAHEGQGLPLT